MFVLCMFSELVLWLFTVGVVASAEHASLPHCEILCIPATTNPVFFSSASTGEVGMKSQPCTIAAPGARHKYSNVLNVTHEPNFSATTEAISSNGATSAPPDTIANSSRPSDVNDVACVLDVSDYLPSPPPHNKTSIQYISIECENRTRLVITNNKGIQNKHIIGYLHIRNCDIYWSDLTKSAGAFDLRVLYLQDRREKFSKEQREFESLLPSQYGDLKQLPNDLQTIGSLQFINTKLPPEPLPNILTDYLWPKLAEVAFLNTGHSEVPAGFQTSMPRLQSLELQSNNMIEAPVMFPWTEQWMNLPLNLSRTPTSNQHYSHSQGFFTPPNLYRRIVNLAHNKLRDLQEVVFRGCLQKIDLSYNAIEHIFPKAFSSVNCMQNLDLSFNRVAIIPVKAFSSLSNLTHLDLSHNLINFMLISGHFVGLEKLEKLDLSHNHITAFGDKVFHPLPLITEIDLSANRITEFPDDGIKFDVEKLVKVNLQHNVINQIPHWTFLIRSLMEVDLSHNSLSFNSFMDSIRNINPSHVAYSNRWSASQFGEPQRTFIKVLNMQSNNFTTLDVSNLTDKDIKILETVMLFFDLDLNENELLCDCHTYSMHLHLLKQAQITAQTEKDYNPYASNNWKCKRPKYAENELISSVANTTFKCEVVIDSCPLKCKCLQRAVDQIVEVDCSYSNIKNVPDNLPQNTQILNMAHNNVQTLRNLPGYLRHLKVIDLSFNNISYVTEDFLTELAGIEELSLHHNKLQELPNSLQRLNMTSVLLRSNPWICDCNSVWFKRWIVMNRQNVEDLDDVTCVSGRPKGSVIIEVPESEFVCEIPISVVIAKAAVGFSVCLIIIIIIALLIFKYRGEIQVYLYVHYKWHPFGRSEKTDVDFKYDAFVSYAGDDYKWVVYQLVSRLEGHVPRFKLCLHDKDFEVGAPIQHNIMGAVKTSRRMVLVLTRKYLASEWCMLEFRAAHERVLNDRSNYLILVLFDDVPIKELEDDMQLYLRTNTYLSVSNKWFWEKLLYAMPKEPLCTLRDDITFDFPYLTEPPRSYPDYMMGYMAQYPIMAQRSELPQFATANEEGNNCNASTDALTEL